MLQSKPMGLALMVMFPSMVLWIVMMSIVGMMDADSTSEKVKALAEHGVGGGIPLLLLFSSLGWVVASTGLVAWGRSLSDGDKWGLATFGSIFVLTGVIAGITANGMFYAAAEAAGDGQTAFAGTAVTLFEAVDWWGSITWMLGIFLIAVAALQQKNANTIILALIAVGAVCGFISMFPGADMLGLIGYPGTALALVALGIQKIRA